MLIGADLTPADSARLEARDPDVSLDLAMTGQMNPYEWGFKGPPTGSTILCRSRRDSGCG